MAMPGLGELLWLVYIIGLCVLCLLTCLSYYHIINVIVLMEIKL